jgi:hypothetical protein
MIFYFSVLLIAAGIFLIIYSLMTSKQTVSAARHHSLPLLQRVPKREVRRESTPEVPEEREKPEAESLRKSLFAESKVAEERIPSDEEHAARKTLPDEISAEQSLDKIIEEAAPPEEPKSPAPVEEEHEKLDFDYELQAERQYAVLYEDSSRIIDYERSENTIDPTLKEYQKIKRVGRGDIELVKEGINFYIGKKFFRFDYHRIKDLKVGDNFIALFLKGSDVVRLFIFNEGAAVQSEIKRSYQDYLRRTGYHV